MLVYAMLHGLALSQFYVQKPLLQEAFIPSSVVSEPRIMPLSASFGVYIAIDRRCRRLGLLNH